MTTLDLLKYGPAGLAALVALWTAGLLTIELRRPGDVRKAGRNLIFVFMGFSLVLFALACGVSLIHDPQISSVREELTSLNRGIMDKMHDQISVETREDRESAERIRAYYEGICESIDRIATIVSSDVKCERPTSRGPANSN